MIRPIRLRICQETFKSLVIKKISKSIYLLLLLLIANTAIGQSRTKEELGKLPRREVSNMIPDSDFAGIAGDMVLTGLVISVCEATNPHNGGYSVGVLKIKSTQNETIYSILTSANTKNKYAVGTLVEVHISPLSKTDNYFKPNTLCCEGIKGGLICILKE